MLIAVCGLEKEARLAKKAGARAVVGNAATLEAELARLLPQAKAILSFGIAGALSPQLKPGDCAIALRVVTKAATYPADIAWLQAIKARLPDATTAIFAGSDEIVHSVAAKTTLRAATGADLVDMESAIAARLAQERGLPFAGLRAISDAADRALPPAALGALNPDGSVHFGRVFVSLLKQPQQIAALIATGRESNKAFAGLLRSLDLAGMFLGCPYLA